jgi:acyl-coenzyme A synthetase/AMP-(fatty) acid ligase/thioesterase domain-containing protein
MSDDDWHSVAENDAIDWLRGEFDRFDLAYLDRPIIDRFREVALRYPHKVAVADGTLSLTYHQLHGSVLHLANRIDRCVPPDRPVAIVLPQGALFPVAALACLAAGRPFAPVDRNYPRARNLKVLRELEPGAVVAGHAGDAYDLDVRVPCIDIEGSLNAPFTLQPQSAEPDAPALILYTSGTTGDPKGICNSQRAILQRVIQATNSCHISSEDRIALLSSFCTIAGVRETFAALLNGATLHVTDPASLGISRVLTLFQESRITIAYAVPALLRALLAVPSAKEAFASFRILRVGGDNPLKGDLGLIRAAAPQSSILIAFSSTEIPTIFQWFVPKEWQSEHQRLPIGYLQPGFGYKLGALHDDMSSAEMAGELIVRSRYLALGYWQRGQLTEGPFVRCDKDPSMRIFHTGDVVRVRSESLVEMLGRKDRQVKLRGYRVNLDEVDAVLRQSSKISDAAVIPRRAREEVSALVAFVVPSTFASGEMVHELKKEIDTHLPSYMQPIHIRVLQEIPKLSGFKPDFQKLAAIDRQELADDGNKQLGLAERAGIADRQPIQHVVESAWTTTLNRSSFESDTAWDEAGGDSLAILSLWFIIEQALGPIPLDVFRPQMKPSALVEAIAQHLQRGTTVRETGSNAAAPLVFFMPPYDGDIPLLVRFRAALKDRVRFSVVHYPGWQEMMQSKGRFESIVDATLSQIVPQIDGRRCGLAGYSFGGIVAWETARRLRERGYDVAFLGLIDTALDGLLHPQTGMSDKASRLLKQMRSAPGVEALADSVIKNLLRRSKLPILKIMNRSIELTSPRAVLRFQRHLTGQLRLRALDEWTVVPLDISATLFRSDDRREHTPDFGWRRVCDELAIVPIGGSHESILQPPFLQLLCDRFAESVGHALLPNGTAIREGVAAPVSV